MHSCFRNFLGNFVFLVTEKHVFIAMKQCKVVMKLLIFAKFGKMDLLVTKTMKLTMVKKGNYITVQKFGHSFDIQKKIKAQQKH